MENKVYNYIKKYNMINEGDRVLAGVSGGADSMCLLLVLLKLADRLGAKIFAVHVNHCLRGEDSDEDAEFVRKFCENNGIECIVRNVDVKSLVKTEGLSEEEAARILRYDVFKSAAKDCGCNKIAVAHHADDQAETVLFQMFRGSGLRGISGILPVRDEIIRPLLCVGRDEIEDYLQKNNINFRTDATNFSTEYSRNKIRLKLLPYIKENINEGIVAHLNAVAQDAAKADAYFREEAQKIFGSNAVIENSIDNQNNMNIQNNVNNQNKTVRLSLDILKNKEIIVSYVFRMCISTVKASLKDIGRTHIEKIYQLADSTGNRQISLPYGIIVKKEYDNLIFKVTDNEKCLKQAVPFVEISIKKEEIFAAPEGIIVEAGDKKIEFCVRENKKVAKYPKTMYTKCFDYDKIENVLSLRTRKAGDFLVVNKSGGRKKIKDYFIDEKIPKDNRDEIILLADGSNILWAVGYRISEEYKITEESKYILEVKVNGG